MASQAILKRQSMMLMSGRCFEANENELIYVQNTRQWAKKGDANVAIVMGFYLISHLLHIVDNQIGLRVGPPVRADYRDRLRPEQDLRPTALLQDGMGNGRRDGSATIARDRFRRRFQYERRLLAIIRHRNAIERVVLLDGWCYRHAPNHRSVGRRGPGSHHYHWVGGLCRA